MTPASPARVALQDGGRPALLVGTRPEAIKLAFVARALEDRTAL